MCSGVRAADSDAGVCEDRRCPHRGLWRLLCGITGAALCRLQVCMLDFDVPPHSFGCVGYVLGFSC